jgi:hypothetical protein
MERGTWEALGCTVRVWNAAEARSLNRNAFLPNNLAGKKWEPLFSDLLPPIFYQRKLLSVPPSSRLEFRCSAAFLVAFGAFAALQSLRCFILGFGSGEGIGVTSIPMDDGS